MTDDKFPIGVELARSLIASQFPHWADLAIRPVEHDGWDNRTFRLGDRLKVRLPSAERYVAQAEKEHRWLPILAPQLPLAVPAPVALGAPAGGFPWPWSVYEWLDGQMASAERIADLCGFASSLARFLLALQRIDTRGGPAAGPRNFFRGGPLAVYDTETRRCITALAPRIDAVGALETWEAALATEWPGRPVWVHGDIAVGNLLVSGGRLSAVIDFGSAGVGDPACDLVIAWLFLKGASHDAFRAALPFEEGTWARARGWALWKALLVLASELTTNPAETPAARVIEEVVSEHRACRTSSAPQSLARST